MLFEEITIIDVVVLITVVLLVVALMTKFIGRINGGHHHTVEMDDESFRVINDFLSKNGFPTLSYNVIDLSDYDPPARHTEYLDRYYNGEEGFPIKNNANNHIKIRKSGKEIEVSYPDVVFPTESITVYKGVAKKNTIKDGIPLYHLFYGFETPSGKKAGSGLGIYASPNWDVALKYAAEQEGGGVIYEIKLGFKRYVYTFINFDISEHLLRFITNEFSKENITRLSKAALLVGYICDGLPFLSDRFSSKEDSIRELIALYNQYDSGNHEHEINDLVSNISKSIFRKNLIALRDLRRRAITGLVSYEEYESKQKEMLQKINRAQETLFKRLNVDLVIGFSNIREIEQEMPWEMFMRTHKYFHITKVDAIDG